MRSTDGGQTWESVLSLINTFTGVSISPVDSNVVWVMSQEQLAGQWVYRTFNGGASWYPAKIDNTLNPADKVILADPSNVMAAWASAGGVGLQRTQDGNTNWQPLSYEFHALTALSSQVLYGTAQWPVGTASVQMSLNGGSTWSNIGHPDMVGGGPLSVVLP